MKKQKFYFYDMKDYDIEFFSKYGKDYNFDMKFLKVKLSEETAYLSKGYDVVSAFTNDDINKIQ